MHFLPKAQLEIKLHNDLAPTYFHCFFIFIDFLNTINHNSKLYLAKEPIHNQNFGLFLSEHVCLPVQELLEKTRERQSNALSEVAWLGRVVPVKSEQVRVLLLSIQQNEKQLSGTVPSTTEQELSICESMLKELIEAQQALKDDLKDDQVHKLVAVNL